MTARIASKAARHTIAPYGTWSSPITPELLTSKSISFGELLTLGGGGGDDDKATHLFYIENRPSEKGRAALISRPLTGDASIKDLTQGRFNARSGVHEYGGGALAGSPIDDSVIFTDYKQNDWGVYRVSKATSSQPSEPERITPDDQSPLRFANFAPHPTNPHLIAAIQEDHTVDEPSKVVNTLVLIDAQAKTLTTLHSGFDFYSHPAWSPTGDFLAWYSWQHPSMPFWATQGWVGRFLQGDGQYSLVAAQAIAGHDGQPDQVISHPLWLPRPAQGGSADTLIFTSDKTGFSNPYKTIVEAQGTQGLSTQGFQPVLSHAVQADFIAPPWTLGNSSIVALAPDLLVCILIRGSSDSLALVTPSTGVLTELDTPYVSYVQLRRASPTSIAAIVGKPDEVPALVIIDLTSAIQGASRKLDQHKHVTLLQRSSDLVSSGQIPTGYLSIPEDIQFPTTLPDGTRTTAHAILFPPTNPNHSAPAGTSPPCILKIHGGPTSSASKQIALQVNFWTSRGYAICFVNYGGSTGYGREYMLRLMDNWGLVDVLDCAAAVRYLGSPRNPLTGRSRDAKANQLTRTAQEQLKNLETAYDTNGSVKVTLKGHKIDWSALDIAVVPALFAAGALVANAAPGVLPGALMPAWALPVVASMGYLTSKLLRAVLSESVWVSRNFGVQLETVRGFKVPFTDKRIVTSKKTEHVPRDRILELGLYSAVAGWTIDDYLALGVRSQPLTHREEMKDGTAITRTQRLLFPHLAPRLPVLQRIHKALYPSLFPSSSNPIENASRVPPLQDVRFRPSTTTPNLHAPLADPKKMVISGGSAGGFTVLACLSVHPTLFSAGTSLYGVADLKALAAESHKFESQYPFRLLSGTPQQVPDVYRDRSPLNHAEKISAPLLVLQGSEDKIVPPNQARMMVDKIKQQPGGEDRVKYIEFEGEGHGFRQSQNVVTALVEEEKWYRGKLGLDA